MLNKNKNSPLLNKSGDSKFNLQKSGFTIVELLVVIVVIGILATITIVSYTGITQKATMAALKSDLNNSSIQLKLYQSVYGTYPTELLNNCPTAPINDTNYCIKASSDNTYSYISDGTVFGLTATNSNGAIYNITDTKSPEIGAYFNPADWLTIGSQVWAKANQNVGTMLTGTAVGINNGSIEKYCYNDTPANCTSYGALYSWSEAMQYATNERAQGICQTGSHVPTDNEWKTLEMQLGMTQVQANATGWRGANQEGTQLKISGSSGLNLSLAGYRSAGFNALLSNGYFWSSTEDSSTTVLLRYVSSGNAGVNRYIDGKAYGFSVRCLKN